MKIKSNSFGVLLLLLLTSSAFAQTTPTIQISKGSDSIIVDFTLPAYTVRDTSLTGEYTTSERFHYIELLDE